MIETTRSRAPIEPPPPPGSSAGLPRVVIVGGGFAGLSAAKRLARQPIQLTLIDRENYHLF
jgi:NADH dehydrogenase